MLILPLGHEHQQSRRWPWVTTALVLMNVLVHLLTSRLQSQTAELYEQKLRDATEYADSRPYLHRSPLLPQAVAERRPRRGTWHHQEVQKEIEREVNTPINGPGLRPSFDPDAEDEPDE